MFNTKLWIGNIAPGTTDDEIREFVKKQHELFVQTLSR